MSLTNRRGSGPAWRRTLAAALGLTVVSISVGLLTPVRGQQVHHNGFESHSTSWVRGPADAPFKETAHDISDQEAHGGQSSEHIQGTAEIGNSVQYLYPVGRAPIADELNISVYIKANRPNMRLMARVVLPKERSADNLDQPLTTLIRGDQYQRVGRWERLELRRPVKLAKEQRDFMRAELKRDVDFTDAYVDQIVLDVYGGPGLTEVWIDDLEVGPVLDADPNGRPISKEAPGKLTGSPSHAAAVIELKGDYLTINSKRFFFRGIRHSDTPLKVLREAGFNTVWLDPSSPPELVEEALDGGFWLVPSLSVPANGYPTQTDQAIAADVTRFLQTDGVLFWELGGGRTVEEAPLVARAAQTVRTLDPQRPLGADIWDGFTPYARQVQLIGAHRWPLMTSLELDKYGDWLTQRRQLAQPRSAFQWTWIQTHLPDWYVNLIYDRKFDAGGRPVGQAGFDEPIGPQPEQIRLLTYTALAAGCKGLGFWSDRFLADSHQGRDRLLTLALLNQELQMLEPLLLSTIDQPTWIGTSHPDVRAAVMRTERGLLVLPMWIGKGAQHVPGQSALAKLEMVVPMVPDGTQAWEVCPGDVRALRTERVIAGTKVILPEFSLTAAIVFTADNAGQGSLLDHMQAQARRTRKLAAQWAYELAEEELRKVALVEDELERMGHTLSDGASLLDDSRARVKRTATAYNSGDYREAYREAQRAVRPLRILMRAQWEEATRRLDIPTASPYAVSFYTLPRHWEFQKQLEQGNVGANVLPDGDFEVAPDRAPFAWTPQETTIDGAKMGAWRIGAEPKSDKPEPPSPPPPGTPPPKPGTPPPQPRIVMMTPRQGERQLKLEIKGAAPIPERTFLAINSPAVHLPPGTPVRISAWMHTAEAIGSVDGALFYDSAGGEPLGVRVTNEPNWRRYTLYRRVPASGTISVTLALTGNGRAYFDDVRIEPLTPGRAVVPASMWRRDGAPPAPETQPR